MNEKNVLNIEEILNLLPHRYPFLLVDRILDFKKGEYLRAIKNVSFNEPFFQGHFPKKPVFPGVLILEAIAQSAGILAFKSISKVNSRELYYLVGIDEARFKYPVQPGDQMIFQVKLIKTKRSLTRFEGTVMVDKKMVCKATMMCSRIQET
ncbi:3-hydroxyacyl-ACP dehydratase FabZ [Candidatus Riesia pediculicola]|uniref:3-hydroxyacyl-[acyl-carrier-protein] dehydratase FabZ n=1 Tax=Riesia pediculicola (strain USDA) TaxID=515618 RepID=D4G8D9_RIEPU|nr:3-hydroxyacyl-ACP dehydratase FabZ [Candidatus Riesia pediculicola]ADD79669.1 beta-hydroxyacyl-(acyl-carrier-protein) dehydratase FabZ [Candidatus Riesia pediculicola USDA]ARC53827.1 hydroxymyristoyl-ACP dehydratase [Candidatus Riesia pediculicola]ARC54544.1 hydroxymyristoyl-ACP dehydratase [Candidatus Riesia pediculicola]QOJ86461.1 3-hydroxyacyl-ACP dehydratase FabZ [Candidatus Riesia pediculicola]